MNKKKIISLLGAVALFGFVGVAGATNTVCNTAGYLATGSLTKLQGTFGLNFSGGDDTQGSGERLVGTGVLTSDGKGHVTNLLLTVNYDETQTTLSLTGLYTIYANGTGFMSLTINGCPSSCTGNFPGGQNGVDITFSIVPNQVLFAADGSDTCYDTGEGDPFYGAMTHQ